MSPTCPLRQVAFVVLMLWIFPLNAPHQASSLPFDRLTIFSRKVFWGATSPLRPPAILPLHSGVCRWIFTPPSAARLHALSGSACASWRGCSCLSGLLISSLPLSPVRCGALAPLWWDTHLIIQEAREKEKKKKRKKETTHGRSAQEGPRLRSSTRSTHTDPAAPPAGQNNACKLEWLNDLLPQLQFRREFWFLINCNCYTVKTHTFKK